MFVSLLFVACLSIFPTSIIWLISWFIHEASSLNMPRYTWAIIYIHVFSAFIVTSPVITNYIPR